MNIRDAARRTVTLRTFATFTVASSEHAPVSVDASLFLTSICAIAGSVVILLA
jgi:hypothetical protein